MAVSADSVVESVGSIMLCVNSGISGNVELALTATLMASEGKASEYKLHFVLSYKHNFMYVVYSSKHFTIFCKSIIFSIVFLPCSGTRGFHVSCPSNSCVPSGWTSPSYVLYFHHTARYRTGG